MANSAGISKRLKPKFDLTNTWYDLTNKWQQLSARDRMALMVLLAFLLVMMLFGAWTLHTNAQASQQAYTNKVNDYFWLRSQAGNLKPQDASQLLQDGDSQPLSAQVSSLLSHHGIINPQVMTAGNGVQLSFEHHSQATVSQAISQLQMQGYVFDALQIRQDPNTHVLQVQANISAH